jgi:hypothetical protein
MKASIGFKIATIVAIIFLIWALDRHRYGYYTLLRFVVCGVSAYGAYFSSKIIINNAWAWIFGIIAILFNPIIQIHLDRNTWAVIDVVVAVVLGVSIFMLKKEDSKSPEKE